MAGGGKRVLLAATVTDVADGPVFYAACKQCYTKLTQATHCADTEETASRRCIKCGCSYTTGNVNFRYRLSVSITDFSCTANITAFGTMLDAFFGATASQFERTLSGLKENFSQYWDQMLQLALQKVLVGQNLLFGFNVTPSVHHSLLSSSSMIQVALEDICGGNQISNSIDGRQHLVAVQMVRQDGRSMPGDTVAAYLKQMAALLTTNDTFTMSYTDSLTLLTNCMYPHHIIQGNQDEKSEISNGNSLPNSQSFDSDGSSLSNQSSIRLSCDHSIDHLKDVRNSNSAHAEKNKSSFFYENDSKSESSTNLSLALPTLQCNDHYSKCSVLLDQANHAYSLRSKTTKGSSCTNIVSKPKSTLTKRKDYDEDKENSSRKKLSNESWCVRRSRIMSMRKLGESLVHNHNFSCSSKSSKCKCDRDMSMSLKHNNRRTDSTQNIKDVQISKECSFSDDNCVGDSHNFVQNINASIPTSKHLESMHVKNDSDPTKTKLYSSSNGKFMSRSLGIYNSVKDKSLDVSTGSLEVPLSCTKSPERGHALVDALNVNDLNLIQNTSTNCFAASYTSLFNSKYDFDESSFTNTISTKTAADDDNVYIELSQQKSVEHTQEISTMELTKNITPVVEQMSPLTNCDEANVTFRRRSKKAKKSSHADSFVDIESLDTKLNMNQDITGFNLTEVPDSEGIDDFLSGVANSISLDNLDIYDRIIPTKNMSDILKFKPASLETDTPALNDLPICDDHFARFTDKDKCCLQESSHAKHIEAPDSEDVHMFRQDRRPSLGRETKVMCEDTSNLLDAPESEYFNMFLQKIEPSSVDVETTIFHVLNDDDDSPIRDVEDNCTPRLRLLSGEKEQPSNTSVSFKDSEQKKVNCLTGNSVDTENSPYQSATNYKLVSSTCTNSESVQSSPLYDMGCGSFEVPRKMHDIIIEDHMNLSADQFSPVENNSFDLFSESVNSSVTYEDVSTERVGNSNISESLHGIVEINTPVTWRKRASTHKERVSVLYSCLKSKSKKVRFRERLSECHFCKFEIISHLPIATPATKTFKSCLKRNSLSLHVLSSSIKQSFDNDDFQVYSQDLFDESQSSQVGCSQEENCSKLMQETIVGQSILEPDGLGSSQDLFSSFESTAKDDCVSLCNQKLRTEKSTLLAVASQITDKSITEHCLTKSIAVKGKSPSAFLQKENISQDVLLETESQTEDCINDSMDLFVSPSIAEHSTDRKDSHFSFTHINVAENTPDLFSD